MQVSGHRLQHLYSSLFGRRFTPRPENTHRHPGQPVFKDRDTRRHSIYAPIEELISTYLGCM